MVRETRRAFCGRLMAFGAAGLFGGQAGLDKFLLPAPPCKDDLTPAVGTEAGFRAGAPVRGSLVEAGMAGQKMTLTGFVTGLTCGRIKGARVDFWQADAAGRLDATGFRLRGAALTDKDGRYSIETIIPGQVGNRAKRIHVRVQPPGKRALSTVLYFPNDAAAERDRDFKKQLLLRHTGANVFQFDFLLDV